MASLKTEKRQVEDIAEEIFYYALEQDDGGQAKLILTVREFPNGDEMIYVEAETEGYHKPIEVGLEFDGEANIAYTEDSSIPELYPYRKPRKLADPLSSTLRYIENDDNSALVGTAVYFKDISHTYDNGEKSSVVEFQREDDSISYSEDGWKLNIQFKPGEAQYSTWLMVSEEQLIESVDQFQQVHKIGADEFRWITPDVLLSHRVDSTFPKTDNAFVRSLVRQSGRMSAVKLSTEQSRVWENINRHHFASLESARSDDGLWHSDYTSTWLQHAYGFGPEYIDSRHNDNIFRSQLTRAELLGYQSYAEERSVYADFLIDMANAGYTIPRGSGYYLIDYYDMKRKTHASLNHVLSLMNYQYDAYRHLKDDKYLESAEAQFAAFLDTGTDWINDENTIIYQMRPDGAMTGTDYNLVTYYDLLYTKKLRQELELPSSDTLELLIKVKEQNLYEKGISIEGTIENVEHFVGLIE
ncbi:hypothetical protein [Planococcus shenhongbingii]|uniref:Uncharacterized protein n=1 Tax=Planococcus shenhongbingii TaxID=3058398 RepID=A0ABT8NAK7_9BACL|nr:hypothetical protein [Planococcus sp. N017]MDN7244580.1 hypothetical protein [Planococcus sp. N017]